MGETTHTKSMYYAFRANSRSNGASWAASALRRFAGSQQAVRRSRQGASKRTTPPAQSSPDWPDQPADAGGETAEATFNQLQTAATRNHSLAEDITNDMKHLRVRRDMTTLALMIMMFAPLTHQDLPPTPTPTTASVAPSTPTKAPSGEVVAEPDPQDVGCSTVRTFFPSSVPTPEGNPAPYTGWVNPQVSCD